MTSSYESKPLRDENRNRRDADSRGPPPPPPPAGGGEEPSSSRGRGGGGIGRRKENDDDNKRGHRYEDRDHHSSRGGRSRSRDRRDYDRDYDRGRRRDHDRHHHDNRRGGGGGGGDDDDDRRNHRDRSRGGRDRRDSGHYGPDRGSENRSPSNRENGRTVFPYYKVVKTPADEKLGGMNDDPRGEDPTKRITKKASSRGAGRNTESFDPASTLVRPDLRVQIGSSRIETYNKPLKHDDVVIVPELFGAEEDWDIYYKLVEEMRALQAKEEEEEEAAENGKIKEDEEKSEMIDKETEHKDGKVKKEDRNKHHNNQRNGNRKGGRGGGSSAKWISWHEGAHLISKNPKGCPTYEKIVARLCEYFNIDPKGSVGTRFNWYRDSSDWKPFHHDSAAFNPQRAKNQNITVGASFGAMRELAFIRASEEVKGDSKCCLYFPQSNNGVFSFGRDANIHWKHGVNALAPDEQDGKGRISIILWGLAKGAIEEEGSPPLLGADGKGPHAMARNGGRGGGGGGGGRNNRRNGRR
ncbi:unnamed protein product [Cylindrotheca closterium]|uniref:Fe2OG dioxygenase domain-containing protein n=1 Tax=Cylindrotheca closterium TaxID=2856 RepID=A0AAD2FPG0_9STRA|nr:unnamed protein product [Cylindrotheca closterium]